MTTLNEIEKLSQAYADRRSELAAIVTNLTEQINLAKRSHIADIRKRVAKAKDAQSALHAAISAAPDLFVKPRTRTLHGIKVGYRKGNGTITWDDEDAVIKRIRAKLPKDQAELLIRVKEKVHKEGVYDLTAEDLKRLGIQVEGSGDVVVIKDATGEVDKLVAALLKENTEGDE